MTVEIGKGSIIKVSPIQLVKKLLYGGYKCTQMIKAKCNGPADVGLVIGKNET